MLTDVGSGRAQGDGDEPSTRQVTAPAPAPAFRGHRLVTSSAATDALIIDASMRQALVATQSLGRSGLRVGTAESSELCDPRFRVPAFVSRWSAWSSNLPNYFGDPDEYARGVLGLAHDHRSRVVIPSSDGAIAALRPWRACFERRGMALALGSDEALTIANDKQLTLEAAAGLGIAGPRTVAISGPDDARAALAQVGYPAVIKPTQSWAHSGRKSARLTPAAVLNEAEALTFLDDLYELGSSAVIQQWVDGRREAVNLVYTNGRVVAELAQVAYRTAPVLGGVNVVRETISMPDDLRTAAVALIESLDLEGYSEVEFRRDSSGRPLVMEINARLTAGVELAVRSGIDFPTLLWQWAAKERMVPVSGYRSGVRMRFLAGDFEWLWENLKRRNRPDSVAPARAVSMFMREFLHRQAYDYVDRRDLRPTLVAFARDIGEAQRRIVKKLNGNTELAPADLEQIGA